MNYLSVCSGIEAATVAWHPLGWRPVAFSEIEPFPCAVLSHHWPEVPNLGDMTNFANWPDYAIDLLVGGTPCQSFSVAGLRKGLADPRGNLALTFLAIAARYRPRWVLWENVPGVLSDKSGGFAALLGGLVKLGYGWAYRILDAQFFGLAQRRRRVFVVGYLGDWRRAAAVLFERASLCGDLAPSREAREDLTAGTLRSTNGGCDVDHGCANHLIPSTGETSHCLNAGGMGRQDYETETLIAHALRADGFDASEDGTGRGTPLVPVPFDTTQITSAANYSQPKPGDPCHPLAAGAHAPAVAFNWQAGGTQTTLGYDAAAGTTGTPERNQVPAVLTSCPPPDTCSYANAEEARAVEALRILRQAVGEETLCQWSLGIIAPFWPAEVLRGEVFLPGFRRETLSFRGLFHLSLARAEGEGTGLMRALWEVGCNGCPPQGWRLHQQLSGELGAYLSRLPYAPSPAERFLRCVWQAGERVGVLRNALSALQEARRSTCREGQSVCPSEEGQPKQSNEGVLRDRVPEDASRERVLRDARPAGSERQTGAAVRRLVVEECEALQGFPRGFTAITYRGKPAADGPRYKALGNSMAAPVVRWIGERIEQVTSLPA